MLNRQRWPFLIPLVLLGLGLAGFTGSSYWAHGSADPLLSPSQRGHREIFARSRGIRSDEWAVDSPLARVQQLVEPRFPVVNRLMGLGHLQRNPFDAPVADWGLAFRPLVWPLLLGNLWSHGVHWFLRSALLFLGVFALLRAVVDDPGGAGDSSRRRTIAAIGAIAVLFSSFLTWWLSHPQSQIVAFAGLVVFATWRHRDARTRAARIAWKCAIVYLSACTFFNFYAPTWGPALWIISGATFDLHWRAERDFRRAVHRTVPLLLLVACGPVLSILYYAPYLSLVAGTLYPGRRIAASGELPGGRLVDMVWPALEMIAPLSSGGRYRGTAPAMNECEAACVEAAPLLLLGVVAALDGPVRHAMGRAVRGAPGIVVACAVLAAWVMVPMPSWVGLVTVLRWTPWNRAWMAFGIACAALATALLAELDAERPTSRQRWRDGAVVGMLLLVAWWLAAHQVNVDGRLVLTSSVLVVLMFLGVTRLGGAWGALILAAAWAVPLVLANGSVNPLLRSRDLFARGDGHAVVDAAVRARPGRVVDYTGTIGAVMAGFGWPVLTSLQATPDLDLFAFLAPDAPGLTPEVYNRYAHLRFALPPSPTRLEYADAVTVGISPCSPRLAAVGVNHFLLRDYAVFPEACKRDFEPRRAGDLIVWSRVAPVGEVGVARVAAPTSALDFDYTTAASSAAAVRHTRTAFEIVVSPGERRPLAYATNLSTIADVTCEGAQARALDAHLVVVPTGPRARCVARYIGTVDVIRAWLRRDRRSGVPRTWEPLRSSAHAAAVPPFAGAP